MPPIIPASLKSCCADPSCILSCARIKRQRDRMSPPPPPFEALGSRPFSFYPAIANIEHNEWLFRKATWSEILVSNAKTGLDVWIPRRLIGEMSHVEDPVIIVGLLKELEYKAGAVWPCEKRVIEMPIAVGAPRPPSAPERIEPAPVINILLESPTDSRILRLIGGTLAVGVLVYLGVWNYYREGPLRSRISYAVRDQSYLELTGHDDYYDVVRKLGSPSGDRWKPDAGELQYRALVYDDRGYVVILMGTDRKSATY